MRRATLALLAGSALLFAGAGTLAQFAWADAARSATPNHPVKVAIRRVTESQYRHAIADTFGANIRIEGRFEPEMRDGGLLAVGNAQLSITPSGFEQYFTLARSIANQALSTDRRGATVGCAPADPKAYDEACARAFVTRYGEILYRRPLTDLEIASRLKAAQAGAEQTGDFYEGLKLALSSLLIAPEFLFRIEVAEPDPVHRGQMRLDGYTKAARLSYLFWDAPPDAELRAAARSGEIHTADGLRRQLDRLSASPRLKDGGRAFFADMLQLDQFEGLTKDTKAYPKFSQAVADSAREQTLRTVIDSLIVRKIDYRDLFTTNETQLNRHLAAVYNVPFVSAGEWATYRFPASAERSGILTDITFLSLFSHPAASSPTKRGVKIHEIFMCEPTPIPPPNVDFSKVQALSQGTVRTRLLAHMEDEACASCHAVSDPIGLSLEHFDSLGQLRTHENGQVIDVSADVDGVTFDGAQGAGRYLHDNPSIPACLVKNVYAYGVGRAPERSEAPFFNAQVKAFAADGYRVPDMMVRVASSPEFFQFKLPASPAKPGRRVAGAPNTVSGGIQ